MWGTKKIDIDIEDIIDEIPTEMLKSELEKRRELEKTDAEKAKELEEKADKKAKKVKNLLIQLPRPLKLKKTNKLGF
jgi:uncharacterized protein YecE (DUF72 family)